MKFLVNLAGNFAALTVLLLAGIYSMFTFLFMLLGWMALVAALVGGYWWWALGIVITYLLLFAVEMTVTGRK
jgi:hypothetical protein